MPPKRKIIGYDKSGAPIYEGDQLQSPMDMPDENLPPINPLPEDGSQMLFDQLQSMNGVNDRMDQLIASGMSPEEAAQAIQGMGADLPAEQQPSAAEPEVRRAEPSLKPTGAQMDLSFIEQLNNAPDDETFKQMVQQLDPVQRHIYDRSYGYKQVTPAWAAQQAENFYKMQDERQKMEQERQQKFADSANSPLTKLAEKRMSALDSETIQGAEQLRRRASNMIWLLDNLRGGKRGDVKDGSEKWRTRVGSVDGRWPSLLSSEETLGWNADFNSLKGMINLNEAQGNKGQGQFSDSERKLMAEAASLGLEQARDEKGFKASFERMYDLAKDAEKSALDKLSKNGTKQPLQVTSSSSPSFTVGQRLTDKYGNVRIYRGMDQSGRPILDPVQ